MNAIDSETITAVVLAGGEARRMDRQDKGLIKLCGKPMVEHIINRLRPQVGNLIVNANRNNALYEAYDYPVISDMMEGYHGPLAGIASAMSVCKTDYLVTVPCDSPFVPADLVARLASSMYGNDIAVANNGTRIQPVFSLLKKELLASLQAFLEAGERKIDRWFGQHSFTEVDFSDYPLAFMNINTPDELVEAEKLMQQNKA